MNYFLQAFLPNHCLHCQEEWLQGEWPLCTECQSLLNTPIDPAERCPVCFSEHYSKKQKKCSVCHTFESPFVQMAAVHEYIGPPKSLLDLLKREKNEALAKFFAALMVVQFDRIGWETPDLITAVPSSLNRRLIRGFNPPELLAREFAKWLGIPYLPLLHRINGEFPQTTLPSTDRKSLKKESFFAKNGVSIRDKRVLLVDDVTITGATAISAGLSLLEMHPKSIYSFSFCKF